MNYCVKKLFASQLILNPCTSQIQNLCLLCKLINVKQEFIENDLRNPDSYFYKILFFKKFSVWLRINFFITFETSGKSDSFLDQFLTLSYTMFWVWQFYNLKEILNVSLSGLVSLSNFKTLSSKVGEKVNFWFDVFKNLL